MNTQHFKDLLEKEVEMLEAELSTIAKRSDENPDSWEVLPIPNGRDRADETEVADSLEALENNNSVVNELEIKLLEVKNALKKIDDGTYGVCEVCGEKIEDDRLEANTSAKTCKSHM
ncbi:MAG: TraR/DksA C4-type zinc finger protein [Nitrospira sp.]